MIGNNDYRDALTRRKETAAKKRRERKREKIAQHYKMLLLKLLSAYDPPDCAVDYCVRLLAIVGYDHDEEVELHDEEFARRTLGATHKLSKGEKEIRVQREITRLRKSRQRILDWQAKATNPVL